MFDRYLTNKEKNKLLKEFFAAGFPPVGFHAVNEARLLFLYTLKVLYRMLTFQKPKEQ